MNEDDNSTALMIAVMREHHEIVELLLEQKEIETLTTIGYCTSLIGAIYGTSFVL